MGEWSILLAEGYWEWYREERRQQPLADQGHVDVTSAHSIQIPSSDSAHPRLQLQEGLSALVQHHRRLQVLAISLSPSKLNLSVLHFHRVHTTVFDTDIQGRLERSCLTQGNDVAFLALHHGTGWHCPLWAANAWEVPISGQTTSGLFVGFTPSNYSSALTINHSICVVGQLSDHKPLIPILLWLNPNPTYPTFPSLHHKPIAIPASFYAFWWCPRCGFFDHVIPHPAAPSLEGLRIAVFGQACGVPVAHRRLDAQLLAFGEHNSNFCDWIYKCLYILDIWYIYIYLIYIWYIMINLYLYSMGLGLENII